MPLPVRSLPVIQNWDCHGCSNCCREYEVSVTEEERHAFSLRVGKAILPCKVLHCSIVMAGSDLITP